MPCCDLCGYIAKYPSYLARHMLRHGEAKAYVCIACGSQFKTSSAFNLHMREKHAPEVHVCQTCGMQFKQRRVLERHVLCHSDEKPFACTQCGYTCKRKQDLTRHVRAMHTGKKRRHRYEEQLAEFFGSLKICFTREYTVRAATFAGRKFARVDFYIPLATHDLILEVDERQHAIHSVSNECQRMSAIWDYHRQRLPDRNLHIVRFNPNAYKENGTVIRPTEDERIAGIQECLAFVPESAFVISYLFYRRSEGQPAVTLDPDYTLQKYVRVL